MTQLPRHTVLRDPLDAGGKPHSHATPFSRPPSTPPPAPLVVWPAIPVLQHPVSEESFPLVLGFSSLGTVGGFCMSRRVQLVTETQSGSHLLVTGRTSLSCAKASRWTLGSQDVAVLKMLQLSLPIIVVKTGRGLSGKLSPRSPASGCPSDPEGESLLSQPIATLQCGLDINSEDAVDSSRN